MNENLCCSRFSSLFDVVSVQDFGHSLRCVVISHYLVVCFCTKCRNKTGHGVDMARGCGLPTWQLPVCYYCPLESFSGSECTALFFFLNLQTLFCLWTFTHVLSSGSYLPPFPSYISPIYPSDFSLNIISNGSFLTLSNLSENPYTTS